MPMDRITAVDAEETEQHDPVTVSMTHNSPSDVHLLSWPLHELEAFPSHEAACDELAKSRTVAAERRYMILLGLQLAMFAVMILVRDGFAYVRVFVIVRHPILPISNITPLAMIKIPHIHLNAHFSE